MSDELFSASNVSPDTQSTLGNFDVVTMQEDNADNFEHLILDSPAEVRESDLQPEGQKAEPVEEICSCCLSALYNKKEPVVVTLCKPVAHKFHSNCVYDWWRSNDSCPLCRQRVCMDTVVGALTMKDYHTWQECKVAIQEIVDEAKAEDVNTVLKCKLDRSHLFYVFYMYTRTGSTLKMYNQPFKLNVDDYENTHQYIEADFKELKIALSNVDFATMVKNSDDLQIDHRDIVVNITTEDLETAGRYDQIVAENVRMLFQRTCEVQYNKYGRGVHKLRFITLDEEFIFKLKNEKYHAIRQNALKVKGDINFVSDTTGNPHKGGKDGGSALG